MLKLRSAACGDAHILRMVCVPQAMVCVSRARGGSSLLRIPSHVHRPALLRTFSYALSAAIMHRLHGSHGCDDVGTLTTFQPRERVQEV